jgi:hypothetical protein
MRQLFYAQDAGGLLDKQVRAKRCQGRQDGSRSAAGRLARDHHLGVRDRASVESRTAVGANSAVGHPTRSRVAQVGLTAVAMSRGVFPESADLVTR